MIRQATRALAASAVLATVLALPACGGLPSTASQGEVQQDLAFLPNGGDSQKLDLYLPEDTSGRPFPLVVFVHGGKWLGGDKEALSTDSDLALDVFKEMLLSNGYAVAAVNYRLSGEARWPAQIHDLKAAVRYLRSRAGELGLDPDRFVAAGDSAGGHLAMMLGTTGDEPDFEGALGTTGVSSAVRAVVSYYGISDLRNRREEERAAGCDTSGKSDTTTEGRMLGAEPATPQGAALAAEASPLLHVDAGDPPMLLFHGRKDCNSTPSQSTRMHEALTRAGVASRIELIDSTHAQPEFYTTPALQDTLVAFLKEHVSG